MDYIFFFEGFQHQGLVHFPSLVCIPPNPATLFQQAHFLLENKFSFCKM